MTISNDDVKPYFSREAICLLFLHPSIKGVTEVKCNGVFSDVKVFTKLLFFGTADVVCTSSLKSLTIGVIYGAALFRLNKTLLAKNTFPELIELIIQQNTNQGETSIQVKRRKD